MAHFVSGTYEQPSATPEVQKEGVRLATFKKFPVSHVFALRLAQAGFFFTGESDKVQCFCCEATHQGWQPGDRPGLIHARISPNCPLVRGADASNLPLPNNITSPPVFNQESSGTETGSRGEPQPACGAPSSSVLKCLGLGTAASQTMARSVLATPSDEASSGSGQVAPMNGGGQAPPQNRTPFEAAGQVAPQDEASSGSGQVAPMNGGGQAPPQNRTPFEAAGQVAPRDEASSGSGQVAPMNGGGQAPPQNRTPFGAAEQVAPRDEASSGSGQVAPMNGGGQAPPQNRTPFRAAGAPISGGGAFQDPALAPRIDLDSAAYPAYSLQSARKNSFSGRQADAVHPVDEYVALGFFYAGYADCVRCFYCGVGLKGWKPEDVPAELHARWRPTCQYLRLVKGGEFVDQVAAAQTSGASALPGSSGSLNVQAPDYPVVRRAQVAGYTDEQIVAGIELLRGLDMEKDVEELLIEVLANRFRNHPQAQHPPNPGTLSQAPNQHPPDPGTGDSGSAASSQVTERQRVLQEENDQMRSSRICRQCCTKPVGVIFLPCRHVVACTGCAPNVRRCTRCDAIIRATANIFFS